MNMAELFAQMPGRLNTEATADVQKTIQWNITGEEAGVWAMEINKGVGTVIQGGVEQPDVTFTVSDKHWLAIAEGKLDAMKAFMTGKIKVKGDMTIAIKMGQFFPVKATS